MKREPVPYPGRGHQGDHGEFERRKAEWTQQHPLATPREYQDAIRQIAKECGL